MRKFILAGNPNVGKSTLFNRLTGSNQHTGNWTGKTVGCARAEFSLAGEDCLLLDSPGTYSFDPRSAEEALACEAVLDKEAERIIYVCDACAIERSIFPLLQLLQYRQDIIVCVNLMDEAAKRGFIVDTEALQRELLLPVAAISAADGHGIEYLLKLLNEPVQQTAPPPPPEDSIQLRHRAAKLAAEVSSGKPTASKLRVDRILSHRVFAWPVMMALLLPVLWLSIFAAQIPSELLSKGLLALSEPLSDLLGLLLPQKPVSALVDGVYRTAAWVVSVMLPPMAVFFPLFSLLEDWGLLPRLAFNMDPLLSKCGGCGQQALCMCMGLGCNAVGVTGCRIIPGKKERLLAMLSNSFIPCNGRFPGLIIMCSLLFSSAFAAALALLGILVFSALLSLAATKLAARLIPGEKAEFILELPRFRKPDFAHSLLHDVPKKCAAVLARALKAAAPAGLVLWLLANTGGENSPLLPRLSGVLDPVAALMGMDGELLLGFIMGLPANELVLPSALMCYQCESMLMELPTLTELASILAAEGWTDMTAVCCAIFTVCHWPCATTLQTIKKESGSVKLTLLAAALPTVFGAIICMLVNGVCHLV